MNMDFIGKLPIPQEIKKQFPLDKKCIKSKEKVDKELRSVFEGKDKRILLIIGPCSADRPDSVIDYIGRLAKIRDRVKDKIIIVPRLYTNKPRTTGTGYKGMLHYPDPCEKPDLIKGVIATRKLHISVLSDFGFACADEMLYPENHRYLSDILGYVAVGARSVENQQHRLTASGLNIPVGMKNPTNGNLNIMLNAIFAAQNGHTFCYRGWEVLSHGNDLSHAILRGYSDLDGKTFPNYDLRHLELLNDTYQRFDVKNPSVIIDTNHSNSGKDPFKQPEIIKDVIRSMKKNNEINDLVKGFMVESYIEDGACGIDEHIYGKSITDACLGWEKTEKLIYEMADML